MSILVTGFTPFTLLTRVAGNPSERVARALGEQFGQRADVLVMDADENCLQSLDRRFDARHRGILMFGGAMQAADCVLELEGVETTHAGWVTKARHGSSFASAAQAFCASLGMPSGTAPPARLTYWCLKSYGHALAWAEPRGVPCAFVHLNYTPLLADGDRQLQCASAMFLRMESAGTGR